MKHINQNNIVSISADSENPNFLAAMLLDEHPKRKYKTVADSYSAVISADIIGGCSDILIAGTNAQSASVSVEDPNEVVFGDGDEWGDDDEWANVPISVTGSVTQNSQSNSLLIELSSTVSVPCVANITLSASPGTTLEAGVVTAKISETYGGKNPKYGIQCSPVDYSIKDENSNGSRYYKLRDIVRTFQISALMTRENALKLRDNFIKFGENPAGWKITDDSSTDWVVFARFDGAPTISHDYPLHSSVNFRLIEVL